MHTSIVFFSDPYISHMHAVYKHALSPPNPQRHTHKITILTLSHITKTTLYGFSSMYSCALYLPFFVKHTHINIHHTHVHSPCILSFMVLFSPSSSDRPAAPGSAAVECPSLRQNPSSATRPACRATMQCDHCLLLNNRADLKSQPLWYSGMEKN